MIVYTNIASKNGISLTAFASYAVGLHLHQYLDLPLHQKQRIRMWSKVSSGCIFPQQFTATIASENIIYFRYLIALICFMNPGT